MGHTEDGPLGTSNWHPQINLGRNAVEIAALETQLAQQAELLRRCRDALHKLTKWSESHYYLTVTGDMIRDAQALLPELEKALEVK